MCTLEAMEIKILAYLYELGVLNLYGGWERQSNLDENVVERLYSAKLVEKSVLLPGFIRLSEHGVGAVLFGIHNAERIKKFL